MHIKNVMVGSSYLWEDTAKQGIHALSRHLLELGCNTEWVTLPLSILRFVKPTHMREKLLRLRLGFQPAKSAFGNVYLVNRVLLTLLHPVPHLPFLDSYFTSKHFVKWSVLTPARLAKNDGVWPLDMLIFDAGGLNLFHAFARKALLKVYRVSDLVCEFPNQTRGRIQSERETIGKADILLPASQPIYDEVIKIRGSADGVHLLPNGVDLSLFHTPFPPPPEYADIPPPRAVFVGALSRWFNWELITEVARKCPSISFCVIGKGEPPDALPTNIHMLGAKPYRQIPGYMQHANVGLIPFKNIGLTKRIEKPLKFYEYLASGLPTVAVPYGMMSGMAPYALFGSTADEFATAIDAALKISDSDRNQLKKEAIQFSWENVFSAFDSILREHGVELQ